MNKKGLVFLIILLLILGMCTYAGMEWYSDSQVTISNANDAVASVTAAAPTIFGTPAPTPTQDCGYGPDNRLAICPSSEGYDPRVGHEG